jgi:hypothetical protein
MKEILSSSKAKNVLGSPQGHNPGIDQEFDSYAVVYHSDATASVNPVYSDNWAEIFCYLNGKIVGVMRFYPNENLPVNSYFGGSPNYYPEIKFRLSKFDDVIKLLRYEKSLRLFLNRDNLNGGLMSGSKSVGEL